MLPEVVGVVKDDGHALQQRLGHQPARHQPVLHEVAQHLPCNERRHTRRWTGGGRHNSPTVSSISASVDAQRDTIACDISTAVSPTPRASTQPAISSQQALQRPAAATAGQMRRGGLFECVSDRLRVSATENTG